MLTIKSCRNIGDVFFEQTCSNPVASTTENTAINAVFFRVGETDCSKTRIPSVRARSVLRFAFFFLSAVSDDALEQNHRRLDHLTGHRIRYYRLFLIGKAPTTGVFLRMVCFFIFSKNKLHQSCTDYPYNTEKI